MMKNVQSVNGKCSICDCELNEFTISSSHKCKCRYCYAQYKRDRNKQTLESKKIKARTKAKLLVKAGVIIRENCKLCGSVESENHHPNYDNPTDVTFLCRQCHNEIHALERKVLCA